MYRADDLVFGAGVNPSEVEAMTLARLRYWHDRAAAFSERMSRSIPS